MKVIIAGSRSIRALGFVERAVRESGFAITEVVCGGARGADELGKRWAADRGIPVSLFPADWDQYGRKAGHIRNFAMGEYADALVAIWDGRSRGTKSMIDIMVKLQKPYHVELAGFKAAQFDSDLAEADE